MADRTVYAQAMKKAVWILGGGALLAILLWPRKARASSEAAAAGAVERGIASWYGPGFAGHLTANQEVFDPNNTDDLTAAHKTLPFNSVVEVTDVDTGRVIYVRINDRGPYVVGRIIDLSAAAADALGMRQKGTANVEIRRVA